MQRITDASAAATLPSPPNLSGPIGFFQEGVPGTSSPTFLRGWWTNMIQEELMNLIIGAGLTPDTTATNFTQVLQAIRNIASGAVPAPFTLTAAGIDAALTYVPVNPTALTIYATIASLNSEIARAEAAEGVLAGELFGVGQSWGNYVGSRALNTVYTNTTGRPIFVYVSVYGSADITLGYSVNGVGAPQAFAVATFALPQIGSVNFVVPSGGTYEAVVTSQYCSPVLNNWNELR